VCCGTGREESIDCPVGCEYLREAHRHEKKADFDASKVPNQDIRITESFLQENQLLLAFIAIALFDSISESPEATDWDVRDALQSLLETYRALQSGLYYQPLPTNLYASRIATRVQAKITDIRKREKEATGATTIRDAAILAVLAFLQRLEYSHNNGRRRCRAFIDFLSSFHTPDDGAPEPGLIVENDGPELLRPPGEPLILL
jgi:hypothetical protein